LSLALLIGVLFLIALDLFNSSPSTEKNPCEYNIDKLKTIDPSIIHYKESGRFKPSSSKLNGIYIDNNSIIYVSGENEVQAFDKECKRKFGFKTDAPSNCIAVATEKDIYLGIGDHVEKYSNKGIKLKKWKEYSKKGFITSIAVNGDKVFVADAGNQIVLHYNSEGNLINIIGKKDKAKGIDGLIIPSMYLDVAVGSFDDLWVANPGRHELENFSFNGDLLSSWGVPSMELEGFAGCCNPVHFAILPNGYFVTYEKGLDRIKLYNQAGKFDCVVAGPKKTSGSIDLHCTFATLVNGLAVDSQGTIYALDATTNDIIIYKK